MGPAGGAGQLWVSSVPLPKSGHANWFFPPGSSQDPSAGGNVDDTAFDNQKMTVMGSCSIDGLQVTSYLYERRSTPTVTLYKNGAATPVSCKVPGGRIPASCSFNGASLPVSSGDTVSLYVQNGTGINGFLHVGVHCQ